MTGGMASRACYTKLNFDFTYVRSLSLRRDTYVKYLQSENDRFGNISTPQEMCVHELYTIESSNMT